MTVEEIIKMLDLKPHPEGGFFRETYRSSDSLAMDHLPNRYTLVSRPSRAGARETLEWQVPPELEKQVEHVEHAGAIAARDACDSVRPVRKSDMWSADDKTDPGDVSRAASEDNERSFSTTIYYLLTPDSFSAMHRLKGDEVYHFYLGDPVEMLNLDSDGKSTTVRLGHDIAGGALLQHVVANGVWQGSRLVEGGKFALMGTTMSPGFSFADYELGHRKSLMAEYTDCAALIEKLTRA
ncbi:MAG: cupin domain-containing protein [Candidatus Melainabacteria bacterium]|nr:cupin domain-containing protein [Candidatus Melainabacteria bacterium]